MLIQGIVQSPAVPSLSDGANPVAAMLGKQQELIVSELHGKFFTQTYRGNGFEYSTPVAGVTLTTTGSTVQTFAIINPAGSGKLIVPIRLNVGIIANVTSCVLGWTVSVLTGPGNVAGTSAITAGTLVSQVNGRTDLGANASIAKVWSTVTLATAPTLKRLTGISWGSPLATTAAVFPTLFEEYDGTFQVGPGTGVFLGASTGPAGATTVGLSWLEIPI
jgi:hypothetical protein